MSSMKILFLGVGGAGMAPLAMWFSKKGDEVFGYDDYLKQSVVNQLEESNVGIIHIPLLEDAIRGFDLVVYSNAIPASHEILKKAKSFKINCIKRGEILAKICNEKKLIAITGSHGKTSTSSLIAFALSKLNMDINFILGGFYKDGSPSYNFSDSEWILAEIDESDGTIDLFYPHITLLLNIDWDHCDHYKNFQKIKNTFYSVIRRTKLISFLNNKTFIEIEELILKDKSKRPNYKIVNDKLDIGRGKFGQISGSELNRSNMEFSKSLLEFLYNKEFSFELICDDFPGVERRQNILLKTNELDIIEDYAHHPSEIRVLLNEVKNIYTCCDLYVVFQPHRLSRTKALKDEFIKILSKLDNLFLLPTYLAFENRSDDVSSHNLSKYLNSNSVQELEFSNKAIAFLKNYIELKRTSNKQIVLFIGAGSIHEFANVFSSIVKYNTIEDSWINFMKGRVSKDCLLSLDEPLSKKTTFKIGGSAKFYSEPVSCADLQALIRYCILFDIDYFCLGRGSNILVADNGYDGLVIRLNNKNWKKIDIIKNKFIFAGSGIRLKELCGFVAKKGYSGFEFLEGIPGTLGGALRMNAGAMGNWTFDIVESVIVLDSNGDFREIKKNECTIEYRKIKELTNSIIIGAFLNLGVNNGSMSVRNRMHSYSDVRKESQPVAPSAGCVFKNPNNEYAGSLD